MKSNVDSGSRASRPDSGKMVVCLGEHSGGEHGCRAAEQCLIQASGMVPLEVKAIFITWCFSQALRLLWASSLINSVTNYMFNRIGIKMNVLILHIKILYPQTFHI